MGTHVSVSAVRFRSSCVVRAASAISATRLAAARSNLSASWYAFLVSSSAKSNDFSCIWEMDFPISIALSACSAALRLCRTAASTSCICCCCSCCICLVSEIHKSTTPSPLSVETIGAKCSELFDGAFVSCTFGCVKFFLKNFSGPWFDTSCCGNGSGIHCCCSSTNGLSSSSWLGKGSAPETTSATRCPFVREYPRIIDALNMASLHFAVVCLVSAPYKEPLERWCLRSNRKARVVRRLEEWVSHLSSSARKQVRASERLARARLCFELSGSRPGMGLVATS